MAQPSIRKRMETFPEEPGHPRDCCMSEHQPGRQPDEAAQGSAPAQPDSQLRLVTEEESAVFADDLAASDESPTIISKNPPAQAAATATAIKATTPETLLGSLRGRK